MIVVMMGVSGSGKTTQLPKICLELGRGVEGMIAHTQPRRVAAHNRPAAVERAGGCQEWKGRTRQAEVGISFDLL